LEEVFEEAFDALQQQCPHGVPFARWERACSDAALFLDAWGADAARLGWTTFDLFGLCDRAPLARYDLMGLVWALQGRAVIALTLHAATVAATNGAMLRWFRAEHRGSFQAFRPTRVVRTPSFF
jgi:hypothetical protein